MPDILQENTLIDLSWSAGIMLASLAAAKLIQLMLVRLLSSKHIFHSDFTRCIIAHARQPLLWVLMVIAIMIAVPMMHVPEHPLAHIRLYLRPILVAMLGWLITGIARGTGEWLENHYADNKTRDALGTRRFNTQIRILMRLVVTVIIILTLVGMAMVIPALRQLGMSLFASAGVAGIVLGIAAKESFSNLIAGAQLALTQQILLGDYVVAGNVSGTIDEITSSYVIVKTWDLRRVVVPLRFFMENSFENWTYHETDMFGPVYLYTDYSVDVAALRAQTQSIVKASKWWDGKRCELIVTDSNQSTLQLRVAVSAKDSSDIWSLQCEVREKLVDYLQREQPGALPKSRSEQKTVESWNAANAHQA